LGPIHKQRWIYACSKQLLDRVIWAYNQEGSLQATLFRPFNWIGPKLDDLYAAKEGSSRVVTQFILNLIQREPIKLVDGGFQKRCFTYVEDGIDCLMAIIENPGGVADGQIFNIGNPANEASVKELAHLLRDLFRQHPDHQERRNVFGNRGNLGGFVLRQGLPGHPDQEALHREGPAPAGLGAPDRPGHLAGHHPGRLFGGGPGKSGRILGYLGEGAGVRRPRLPGPGRAGSPSYRL
jgi:hypothetical protein